MGKKSRCKGARGELEVRDLFVAAGFSAKRSVGQSRIGSDSPDVIVERLDWLWIESKLGASPSIRAALRQAEEASRAVPGQVPVAVTRRDREPAIVSLRFDAFAALLRRAHPEAIAPLTED